MLSSRQARGQATVSCAVEKRNPTMSGRGHEKGRWQQWLATNEDVLNLAKHLKSLMARQTKRSDAFTTHQ